MKKKLSVWLSITLVFQLIVGAISVSASAAKPSDISGHWAEQTIQSWLDQGIVTGYKDGSFKPNASISRAEFIKMMNNVFQVPTAQSAVSYKDLPEQHWAYADIAAAVEAGYVTGTSETTISPDANITRQEAAVMLVKLAKLEGTTDLNFKDAADIPEWSKKAITALVANNLLEGDPSGNVRAKDTLKRAEAVVLIDKVAQSLEKEKVFDQEGEYGTEDQLTVINGDVRIAAAGVTLVNTEITGNLTIDAAVGEGDVYLKKVVVKGTTFVQGGGENSVHLEDTVVLRIIVDKASGKVRIVAQGATKVEQVAVQSPVKLEESQVTDTGFSNIELTPSLPEGSNVDLVGHFENVHVLSANIQITIPSGSINQLSVGDGATGNTIALDQAASIETLVLDVITKLIGQGTVNKAQVAPVAKESSFETAPKQLEVVENGTPTATEEPIVVPPSTSKPKPTPTATVTPTPTVSPKPTESTEPTATVTPSPSTSPEPTPTVSPKPTESTEPTATVTPSPSTSPEPTPTVSPKPTESTEPTATVTPSPSTSPEPTPTVSPKPTESTEPTATVTPSPSVSPSPTAKPDDKLSNDATIHSLTLNNELKLTKMDINKESDLPVAGFDPTYFRYSVDLPEDKQTIEVTIQVETEENASVFVHSYNQMNSTNDYEIKKQGNQYTIKLNTDQYFNITFSVESESGKYIKGYDLFFVGALDVQKNVRMAQYGESYYLQSNHVKAGDLVTVTIPAQHSQTGKDVIVTAEENSYYKYGSYDNVFIWLSDFLPSAKIGKLGLEIERNGKTIYEGEYQFDLTVLEFKELPESLLNINYMSKDDVNAFNNNGYNYNMMAYQYSVKANEKELLKLYPNAAFVKYDVDYKDYNPSTVVYTKDSQKSFYSAYGGNLLHPNRSIGYSDWYDPIENLDVYEIATGQILRVMLYDADENLIEALITEFDVPEEHLADHVVPLKVVTEEELEGVPLELTAIQSKEIEWQKNLIYNYGTEEPEDLSFSSDYKYYVGSFDPALDGQTVEFVTTVADGFQIEASVSKMNRLNNDYSYESYYDVQKKGFSLKLDSDYNYSIRIIVKNPYTMEMNDYVFNLNSNNINEQFLKLNNERFHVKNSLPGDLIELTIPGAFNSTGEDLVYSYTVPQTDVILDNYAGIYISNFYQDLSSIYDPETEQYYSFKHNNGVGSLAVKIVRNDSVIYDGKLAFDFTPIALLDDVTVYMYSDEELELYNASENREYSTVLQYDFSAIEGAAYIGYPNHFSSNGQQPNVQSAGNVEYFIKLDAGKHTAGFTFYSEESTSNTINDAYYVYDSNDKVLGYVYIQYEVSVAAKSYTLATESDVLPVENDSPSEESDSLSVESDSLPAENDSLSSEESEASQQ